MTPSMTEMAHPDTTTTKSMIFHGFLEQSLREEIFGKIMIVVNMWVEIGMSDWDNWTLCEHFFIDFTCNRFVQIIIFYMNFWTVFIFFSVFFLITAVIFFIPAIHIIFSY